MTSDTKEHGEKVSAERLQVLLDRCQSRAQAALACDDMADYQEAIDLMKLIRQRPTPEPVEHGDPRAAHESAEALKYAIAVITGLVPAQATATQMMAVQRHLDGLRRLAALEVQREGWVNVKDRLPDNDRYVFVSMANYVYKAYCDGVNWYDEDREPVIGVVAWREFPEPFNAALEAAAKVEPVTKIPRYHVTQTWSCGCGATSETDPRTFVDHTRSGHRAPHAERAKDDAAKGKP